MEEPLAKYIQEQQLVSVMNNTKWKKLVSAITANPDFVPHVRLKYIFEEENKGGFTLVWWEEVEQEGFNNMEWLDINPVKEEFQGILISSKLTDYTVFIKEALEKNYIPYEIHNGIFRVKGYQRTR